MADLLQSFLEFWVDVILLVPRLIFWVSLQLLEMVISVISDMLAIPPEALAASFPPDILYFLTMFQLHLGLPWVGTALLTRFIVRRMPLIG
ncbi:hypothetical protein [Marinobacter sp.]|uniref:hypothetical protein n=1 Tax=Marinobacter sp. TaxID=50741 RepID=UPI0019B87529|nr:hypothetical protein [Marinobacter sp.]MBD3657801.1 hypothetical protein [Marinobacter sp.]